MIFWDSSAVVPLLVEQPASPRARRLRRSDAKMIAWWGTPIECLSALARMARQGEIDDSTERRGRRLLQDISRDWREVAPIEDVRSQAAALVLRHCLRAGDSLQLGAALTWSKGRPSGRSFATFDDRLADAARAEGFELPLARDR